MADMETTVEKHYCYDHPSAYQHDNSALCAALMNKSNESPMAWASLMKDSNQMNNPMWLVWMMAMRWMYGNGDGYGGNAQIAQLQGQVADNQNFNSVLNALTQNANAMQNIADRTNTSIDFVRQSLCALSTSVQNVAGKTELSAERVINAINLGDANITSQMLQCCCQQKQLIVEQGYQNQLANERQTGILGSKIDAFASQNALGNCQQTNTLERAIEGNRQAVVNGFSQIGFQMANDKNDTMRQAEMLNQRVIDTLNNHWQSELQQKYADAKLELSQQAQNAYLVSQLKTT